MLRFKVYYQWRRHNWSGTNFYSLISLANILLTTSLLRKPALLSAMLWFAGLLLGPVTYPPFIPLASQCVWELQYVTKDINSTLLLYFKHSPFLGNRSLSLPTQLWPCPSPVWMHLITWHGLCSPHSRQLPYQPLPFAGVPTSPHNPS